MKRISILFITIGLLALLVCCVVLMISFLPNKQPTIQLRHQSTTSQTTTPTSACITIKNLTVRETLKNRDYRIIIKAQEGKVYHIQNKIECNSTMCNMWHNSNCMGYIFSEKAFIDKFKKEVFFSGLVHGQFEDITFRASNIAYDFANQIVNTEATITYTHPSFAITAHKSQASIQDKIIHLTGGVRSEFFIKSK